MRFIILFIILLFSFSYSQENCTIERVQDPEQISAYKPESHSTDNWTYTVVGVEYRTFGNKEQFRWVGKAVPKNNPNQENDWLPMAWTNIRYIDKEVCDDPPVDPPKPEKCDFVFCSGADKKRFKDASWYETGSGCSSQVIKSYTVVGGYKYVQRFSCSEPKESTDVCLYIPDEPVSCTDDDSNIDEENPIDPPDPEVPCFGNVEDCNSNKLPDYIDPETGVPCFGSGCNNATPPDSIGPDGVPCWGDKCGISPPVDRDPSEGGGDNGGGPGGGPGGVPGGDGDGDGENWGNCPPGGCPNNSSFINGQAFAKVPDTFYETKYRDDAIEKALDEYLKENPFDFGAIDTELGGGAICPVNYVIPFFHGVDIKFSIPCSVFEQLKTFFLFLSYLFAFYHVFRKRG